MKIPVTVIDSESDPVALTIEFDAGQGFQPISTTTDLEVGSSAAGTTVQVLWDAASDLGSTAYRDDLRLRVEPRDPTGIGNTVTSDFFAFGNDAPALEILPLSDDVSALTVLRVRVGDSSLDPVDIIRAELSPLGDFSDAIELDVSGAEPSDFPAGGLDNLATDTVPVDHAIAWDSLLSAAGSFDAARLRLTVVDVPSLDGAPVPDLETTATSDPFSITNQSPPQVIDVRAPRLAGVGGSAPVAIEFTVIDRESDPVDVAIDVSYDGGEHWTRAVEHVVARSEGRLNLSSAPGDAGGIRHTFVWSAPGNRISGAASTTLRVWPYDASEVLSSPTFATLPRPVTAGIDVVETTRFDTLFDYNRADEFIFESPTNVRFTAGDFNGDGWTDFAVSIDPSTADAARVLVFLAELGTGSLAYPDTPASYVLGTSLTDIGSGDADLDGDIDLVVYDTDSTAPGAHLLLNAGNGAFTVDRTFSIGSGAQGFRFTDVDGDGVLDLVTSNTLGGGVEIALGSVDASNVYTPAPATLHAASTRPYASTFADLNGDGKLDLVVSDGTADAESLSLWLAGESAPAGTEYLLSQSIPLPPLSIVLEARDLDRDEQAELYVVSAASTNSALRIYCVDDEGSPGTVELCGNHPTALAPASLAFADVNGDNYDDVWVSYNENFQGERLTLFLTDPVGPSGSRVTPGNAFALLSEGPDAEAVLRHMVAEDLDHDGRIDLGALTVSANFRHGLYVYRDAGGNPFPVDGTNYVLGELPLQVAVVDGDSDGILDLIARDAEQLFWLPGLGRPRAPQGQFGAPQLVPLSQTVGPFAAGDLDGDGFSDMAIIDSSNSTLRVYWGVSPNLFDALDGLPDSLAFTGTAAELTLEDISGDRVRDLVLRVGGSLTTWISETSAGVPQRTFGASTTTSGLAGRPSMPGGDINGDGLWDFVVSSSFGGVTGYLGNGDGSFSAQTPLPGSAQRINYLADLDGDGDLDVLGGGNGFISGGLFAAAGNGDGTFGALVSQAYVPPVDKPIVGYFDWNAGLDLLGPERFGVSLNLWRDTSLAGFDEPVLVGTKPGQVPVEGLAADLNGDGTTDIVQIDAEFPWLTVILNSWPEPQVWAHPLVPFEAGGTSLSAAFGSEVDPVTVTFSGVNEAVGHVVIRPALTTDFGFGEFRASASAATGSGLATARTLTRVWDTGDHLLWRKDLDGNGASRYRVEQRFGASNSPRAPREGLNLGANANGILLRLPIRPGLTVNDIASASNLRVFRRVENWLRADEHPDDPFFSDSEAHEFLPLHDAKPVIAPRYGWAEIPVGSSDWSEGTGERFRVRFNDGDAPGDPASGWVEILVEELGEYQAFWVP